MFEDQWEGVPLASEHQALLKIGQTTSPEGDPMRETFSRLAELGRYTLAASCWHQADTESMAMWKIYSGTGQGCCIVAEMDWMITTLSRDPGLTHFPVTYVNRDSHFSLDVPLPPLHHSARYKDEAYTYENEYRFVKSGPILTKRSTQSDGSIWTEPDFEASTLRAGMYVPLLLEPSNVRILLSPFLKPHELGIIKRAVSLVTRYEIQVDVSRLLIS